MRNKQQQQANKNNNFFLTVSSERAKYSPWYSRACEFLCQKYLNTDKHKKWN